MRILHDNRIINLIDAKAITIDLQGSQKGAKIHVFYGTAVGRVTLSFRNDTSAEHAFEKMKRYMDAELIPQA